MPKGKRSRQGGRGGGRDSGPQRGKPGQQPRQKQGPSRRPSRGPDSGRQRQGSVERIGANEQIADKLDVGDVVASCKIEPNPRRRGVLIGKTPQGHEIDIPSTGIDLSAVDRDNVAFEIVDVQQKQIQIGPPNNRRDAQILIYIGVPSAQKTAWEAAQAGASQGQAGGKSPDATTKPPDKSQPKPPAEPANINKNHELDPLDSGAEVECTITEEQPGRFFARGTDATKPYRIALPVVEGFDYNDLDLTQPLKVRIESRKDPAAGASKPRIHYTGFPEGLPDERIEAWRAAEAEREREDSFKKVPLALQKDQTVSAANLTEITAAPGVTTDNVRRYHMQAADGRDVWVTSTLGWDPARKAGGLEADISITEAPERGTHYEAMLVAERDFALAYEQVSHFTQQWLSVIQAVGERVPAGQPGEGNFVHAVDVALRDEFLDQLRNTYQLLNGVGEVISSRASGANMAMPAALQDVPALIRGNLQQLEHTAGMLSTQLPIMRMPSVRPSVDRPHQVLVDIHSELSKDATIITGPAPDLAAAHAEVERLVQELDRERAPRFKAMSSDKTAREIELEGLLEAAEKEEERVEIQARNWWPDGSHLTALQQAMEAIDLRLPDLAAEALSGEGFDDLRRVLEGIKIQRVDAEGHAMSSRLSMKNDPVFRTAAGFSGFEQITQLGRTSSTVAGVMPDGSFRLRSVYDVTNSGRTEQRYRQVELRPGDEIHNLRVSADGLVLFDTGDVNSGTIQARNQRQAELAAQGGHSPEDVQSELDSLSHQCTIQEFAQLVVHGVLNLEAASRADREVMQRFIVADLPATALVRFLRREPIALGGECSLEAFENRGPEVLQLIEEHVFDRIRAHFGFVGDDFAQVNIARAGMIAPGRNEIALEVSIDGSDFSVQVAIDGTETPDQFKDLRAKVLDEIMNAQLMKEFEVAVVDTEAEERRARERIFTKMRPGARGEIVNAEALAVVLLRDAMDPPPTHFEIGYADDNSGEFVLIIDGERERVDEALWRELFIQEEEILRFTENMPEPSEDAFPSMFQFCEEFGITPPLYPGAVLEYRAVGADRERGQIQATDGSDTPAFVAGTRIVVQEFIPGGARGAESPPQVRFWYRSGINERGEVGSEAQVGNKTVGSVTWDMPADEFAQLLGNRQPLARFTRVESQGSEQRIIDEPIPPAEQLLDDIEQGRPINGEQMILSLGLPSELFKLGLEDDSEHGYVVRYEWTGPDVPAEGEERTLRNGDVCRIIGFDDDNQEVIIALEDHMGRIVGRDFRASYQEMIEESYRMEAAPANRLYSEIQKRFGIHDPARALLSRRAFIDEQGRTMFVRSIDEERIHYFTQDRLGHTEHLTHQEFVSRLGDREGTIRYNPARANALERDQARGRAAISGYFVPEDVRRTPRDRFMQILGQHFEGVDDSPIYLGIANPAAELTGRNFLISLVNPDTGQAEQRVIIVDAAGLRENSMIIRIEGDSRDVTLTYNQFIASLMGGHIKHQPLAGTNGGTVRTVRMGPAPRPTPRPDSAPVSPAPTRTVPPARTPAPARVVPSPARTPAPGRTPGAPTRTVPTAEQLRAASGGHPRSPDTATRRVPVSPERVAIPPFNLPDGIRNFSEVLDSYPGDSFEAKVAAFGGVIESKARQMLGWKAFLADKVIKDTRQGVEQMVLNANRDITASKRSFMELRANRGNAYLDASFLSVLEDEQSLIREIEREIGRMDAHMKNVATAKAFGAMVTAVLQPGQDINPDLSGHWQVRMDDITARYRSIVGQMESIPAGQYGDASAATAHRASAPPVVDDGYTRRVAPRPTVVPSSEPRVPSAESLRATVRIDRPEPVIVSGEPFSSAWETALSPQAAADLAHIKRFGITPADFENNLAEFGENITVRMLGSDRVQIMPENGFGGTTISVERFLRDLRDGNYRTRNGRKSTPPRSR